MKRPVGIREMGSRQTYQICSPSCDDTVDMNYLEINEENNWNITGSFEVNGDMGYIYIKTNAS